MNNTPGNTLELRHAFGRIVDAIELHGEETMRRVEQEANGLIKGKTHSKRLS